MQRLPAESIAPIHHDLSGDANFSPTEVAAQVERGNGIEAIHYATIAVVTPTGGLFAWLGDPYQSFFTRSAIKPFQGMEFYLSGAAEKYQFSDQQLALMCASHNGTDLHREIAASILTAAGASVSDLLCGSHLPTEWKLFNKPALHEEDKDPLRHNCSGKHSGFLALSAFLNEPFAEYLNTEFPLQKRILANVARACDIEPSLMPVGIDGCSAPNVSMPVINLAKGFLRLATGTGWDVSSSAAMTKIRDVMMAHPILIAGERRFDYDLMRSLPGKVVAKVGAEACEGIGIVDPPMGIAIKIHDGGDRAHGPVCVRTLIDLGVISETAVPEPLLHYYDPEVRNYRRTVTGRITTPFRLHRRES